MKKVVNCRGLSKEVIGALYLPQAEKAYKLGYFNASELRSCSRDHIEFLTSHVMLLRYQLKIQTLLLYHMHQRANSDVIIAGA